MSETNDAVADFKAMMRKSGFSEADIADVLDSCSMAIEVEGVEVGAFVLGDNGFELKVHEEFDDTLDNEIIGVEPVGERDRT